MARLRSVLMAVAALGLVGCAAGEGTGPYGTASPTQPTAAYVHRASTSEVVLYWNCARPDPEVLRLEGIAQSPWEAEPIDSLRFELVGVDAKGHGVSEARAEARDSQLTTNQSTPYRLDLRTSGREVRFDLFFQYYFTQPAIDARLAGPPMVPPRLLADTMRSLIRDVCGETQHLAR
jgi:hypothetical protein